MSSSTVCSLRPAVAADWPAIAALLASQAVPTAGAQDLCTTFWWRYCRAKWWP